MANYMIARFDEIDAIKCPCGFSRRAFVRPDNPVATMHIVDIKEDARVHYHEKLTEVYLVLEGEGYMELDGEMVPVKPLPRFLSSPAAATAPWAKCESSMSRSPPSTPKTNGSTKQGLFCHCLKKTEPRLHRAATVRERSEIKFIVFLLSIVKESRMGNLSPRDSIAHAELKE